MSDLILSLSKISLSFGGEALFESASLEIEAGARIALVGRNGSGKSTLLKIAAGVVEADDGDRFKHPESVVYYLPQEPDFGDAKTARDYVINSIQDLGPQHEAEIALEELGVDPDLKLAHCSGGEARRTALAAAIAAAPDILLLDEPTNHLDLAAIAWLENRLRQSRAALVIVSHDRRFLSTLSSKTVWVDRGQTRTLNKGFKHFENWRDKYLEDEEQSYHKLSRKIVAEEHWLRYGVTARRKRNMRRLGELVELRKSLRERRRPTGAVAFGCVNAQNSGKRVIVAKNISKTYGAQKIITDFSVEITRGEKVGIVAPNGAGKTTLLNILLGALAPDDGWVELGANVNLITLDQQRSALKPAQRLIDAITDERGDWVDSGDGKRHAASYLQDFLFKPEQWRAPVESLSGGEQGRLALAAALAKPSNVLALDEPTNDLDLETLDLLEEKLANYSGTLLLISHDRAFLDNIATAIITIDADDVGMWRRYTGGYDDMVAQRGAPPLTTPLSAPKTRTKPKPSRTVRTHTKIQKKLSYKEKFALETLPKKIEQLQKEIGNLKSALADTEFYERDSAAFNEYARTLETKESMLQEAEEEWLAAAIKNDALNPQ